MQRSSLVAEISDARLSPVMRRAFARGLRTVAVVDRPATPVELRAIEALLGGDLGADAPREPLECIWPHAELFVRACVHLALVDGAYRTEEARAVGLLAQRLGISAQRLAALERAVFASLERASRRGSRELDSSITNEEP